MGQNNQANWEWQQMLDEQRQVEEEATLSIDIGKHLLMAAAKPSRIRVKRDRGYLAEQAQGLFIRKAGQGSMNPTDHQLDKIFRGEL